MPYTSRTVEFAADYAECIAAYKAGHLEGFDRVARAIRARRGLDDAGVLTLVTAVTRAIVTGAVE